MADLVPIIMVADKAVRTKQQEDDILEECGAEVMDIDHPRPVYTGLGKPLQHGLIAGINYKDSIVMDNQDIIQEQKETLKQQILKLSFEN